MTNVESITTLIGVIAGLIFLYYMAKLILANFTLADPSPPRCEHCHSHEEEKEKGEAKNE